MTEQIKIDFDKVVKTSGFSEEEIKLKKNILINLQKEVFQTENLKIGSFQT